MALTEIEHFKKEIIQQPEKRKRNESPPYRSCSNVLEEMNYGIEKFLKCNLMNFKVAVLLEFKDPLILPESSVEPGEISKYRTKGQP